MRPPPPDDARGWRIGSRRRGGALSAPRQGLRRGRRERRPRGRDAPDVDARGASPATCLEHAGPRAAATHGRVVADMSRAAGRTEIIAEGRRLLRGSLAPLARAAR